MTTLTIKDKPATEALDRTTMAATHGGAKNVSFQRTSMNGAREWMEPIVEFLILRIGTAFASALITYASYRMFLL